MSFATCYYILQSYLEGNILHFYNPSNSFQIIYHYHICIDTNWKLVKNKWEAIAYGNWNVEGIDHVSLIIWQEHIPSFDGIPPLYEHKLYIHNVP